MRVAMITGDVDAVVVVVVARVRLDVGSFPLKKPRGEW